MKTLTIILTLTSPGTLHTIRSLQPIEIFRMLCKAIKRRTLACIIEGNHDGIQFTKCIDLPAVYSIFFVLTIKYNTTIGANSESIWNCIRKFARDAAGKYRIIPSRNHQVVQFSDIIRVQPH